MLLANDPGREGKAAGVGVENGWLPTALDPRVDSTHLSSHPRSFEAPSHTATPVDGPSRQRFCSASVTTNRIPPPFTRTAPRFMADISWVSPPLIPCESAVTSTLQKSPSSTPILIYDCLPPPPPLVTPVAFDICWIAVGRPGAQPHVVF